MSADDDAPPTKQHTSVVEGSNTTEYNEELRLARERFSGRRLNDLLRDVDVLVRVLGEVEIVRLMGSQRERLAPLDRQGQPVRPEAMEAITYLAVNESPVDREDLEISLFPLGIDAAKTVYDMENAARDLVGKELFPPTVAHRYVLSERVRTDYSLFCDLVAQADETDDNRKATWLLNDALSLVRGEPFTGEGRNYSWAGPRRGMIISQILDVAEHVAEYHLARGYWPDAQRAAEQGLRAVPRNERMYRVLMRAANSAGTPQRVRELFRELCDATTDLGIEPESILQDETVALFAELTGDTEEDTD